MACGGMGGCGDSTPKSNHHPKAMKNWGGMNPSAKTGSKVQNMNGSGGFGTPKVRMSFGRSSGKRGY